MEIFCVVLWRIWFWRNQLVHSTTSFRREEIFAWAADYLEEFRKANLVERAPCSMSRVGGNVGWRKPISGFFKINTDAAIRVANKMVGMGAIIRNSDGKVIVTATRRFDACYDPPTAEAIAILFGLRMAVDRGLLPTVLESDAKGVVDMINDASGFCANIGVVLSDVVSLANQNLISISFIPRKANGAAHGLAKLAFASHVDLWWQDSCPPCLESIVRSDCFE